MPFLSLLDDRAKPKGSRDPLGFELVWTHYGRQVIGNLTTITSSLSNFAVALLGFQWANELNANAPADEKQRKVRETFLRYEQLTGYLRYLANDKNIMGITRVSKRMDNNSQPISFGTGVEQQILSDQASYGLWGLYSTATAESGLVKGDCRLPTELGKEIALMFEKSVEKSPMINLLKSDKLLTVEDLQKYAKPFVKALNKKKVRTKLLHVLMGGGDPHSVQVDLWEITQALAKDGAAVDSTSHFISLVKDRSNNQLLTERLTNIEKMERLLVATNNLFHYCRLKDGEPLQSVVDDIGDSYCYKHLPENLDLMGVHNGSSLLSINQALRDNDTAKAIAFICDLNKSVMAQRSGAPWVEIEPSRKLRVRVPNEIYSLYSQERLELGWNYEYFISSFLHISRQALERKWKAQ